MNPIHVIPQMNYNLTQMNKTRNQKMPESEMMNIFIQLYLSIGLWSIFSYTSINLKIDKLQKWNQTSRKKLKDSWRSSSK